MVKVATPHDADARAPVFVEVEAVGLYPRGEAAGERVEGAVEAEHGGDEVEERRLVGEVGVAEEARAGDVPGAPLRLDAPPVVSALERERGVLRDLQLDDDE